MLDTNIVSQLLNDPAGSVAKRIAALSEAVSISVVVAAELRFGAAKRESARLSAAVQSLLEAIDVEPIAPPVDAAYGALRARLEANGQAMGANDLFIAAHALTLNRTLVTHDRAFAGVPGLTVEDWIAA